MGTEREQKMQPDAPEDPPEKEISKRLQEAVEQLHQDVHRVEVWAGALSAFAQPVPKYEPKGDFLLPEQQPKDPDSSKS